MNTRRPLIAGNWKMHKTMREAREFIEEFGRLEWDRTPEVAILAPYTCLAAFTRVDRRHFTFGAQNMFWEQKGAFTGEISPVMLAELGCDFVLVGHSERRQILGETDEMINRKLQAAVASGFRPILCVGETLDERQNGKAKEVVEAQLKAALDGLRFTPDLVIAYEPVWAIGTGVNASGHDAQEMCSFIRELLRNRFSADEASQVRILYGGSVNPENIKEFMAQPDIDGALVGGASLNPETFARIINYRR